MLRTVFCLIMTLACSPLQPSGGRHRDATAAPLGRVEVSLEFQALELLTSESQPLELVLSAYFLDGEARGRPDGSKRRFPLAATGEPQNVAVEGIGLGWREFLLELRDANGSVLAEAVVRHLVTPGTQRLARAVRLSRAPTLVDLEVELKVSFSVVGQQTVLYSDVEPIWSAKCASCHAGPFIDYSSFPFQHEERTEQRAIVEQALERINRSGSGKMPPRSAPGLAPDEVAKLQGWLDGGLLTQAPPSDANERTAADIKRVTLAWSSERSEQSGDAAGTLDAQGVFVALLRGLKPGETLRLNAAALGPDDVELARATSEHRVPASGPLEVLLPVAPAAPRVELSVVVE